VLAEQSIKFQNLSLSWLLSYRPPFKHAFMVATGFLLQKVMVDGREKRGKDIDNKKPPEYLLPAGHILEERIEQEV
jgi:hypothetical protein